MDSRFFSWGDENVPELDSGDDCITLRIYTHTHTQKPLNCTVLNGTFYVR